MPKAKKKAATPRRTPRKSPPDGEAARFEQFRQKVLTEAIQAAEAVHQENLSKTVSIVHRMCIDKEVLEHELMRLAVGLDPDRHPEQKRLAIESAFIIKGVLESKGLNKVITIDQQPTASGVGIYQSVFNRSTPAELPPTPPPTAADLYPQKPDSRASQPPGSTDEPPAESKANPRVLTVEIG